MTSLSRQDGRVATISDARDREETPKKVPHGSTCSYMGDMPMTRLPLTKIVATVGPATEDEASLTGLINAGVSMFRLNFSHGEQSRHEEVFNRIRLISTTVRRPIAVLQDLQGPKLRVGDLQSKSPVELQTGDPFIICTRQIKGTATRVSTSYEALGNDVEPGDTILIDDGAIELLVTHITHDGEFGDEVVTTIVHGGMLKPQKGINLPGTEVSAPALTEKDLSDLAFGVRLGVDAVALSFVRSPTDVLDAKRRIADLGGTQPVIAKIEKPQAVEQLPAIVDASDGLMVARGDLGVEISPEVVPLIQKRLIRLANHAGKPVITATQMLESMIENPRPTRAEASDVANAILDGTDAVMLSGETAIGAWPIRAVEVMARIASTIEQDPSWHAAMRASRQEIPVGAERATQAVAHAAQTIASDLDTPAIAVLTATGRTAMRISQQRPGVPIVAFTDDVSVASRLSFWHGTTPLLEELETTTDALIRQVNDGVKRLGLAKAGDNIVIVGAVPRANNERSVFLEIHRTQ